MNLQTNMKTVKYKNLLFVLLIPISFILTYIAKNNISFAEFYATKIYTVFAQSIGFVSGLLLFSLGEVLLVIGLIFIIIYIIVTTIKSIKNKTSKYAIDFVINIVAAASLLYFLFVLFCGLNYYRYEFTYYSGLEIKKSTKGELVELCESLINDANYLRTKVKTNEDGVATLYDESYYETSKRAQYSFNNISSKYEVLKGSFSIPKPILFSRAMSYMQITGVFYPFTFESNVNVDIPAFEIPATMCHELLHLRGFMREDEANFLSYLACINSGYDDFAYSGTMLALTYSMNALYVEDYDAFKMLYKKYAEDVHNDIKYSSSYWKQFETKIAEISSKVNDTYLKANAQADGVKSYGRMVDLLLAERRQKNSNSE